MSAAAYDAKEVDVDDDDFDVGEPKEAAPKSMLPRGASGLGLGALAKSSHNLKAEEELTVRGEDVVLELQLPDGRKLSSKFPVGQDVAFVKAFVANETGVPISAQTFRLSGQVMIDPLSLRDYAHLITPAAGGKVAVQVTFASEAK